MLVSWGEGRGLLLRELAARIERIRGRYEALGVPQLRRVTVDALKTHTLLVGGPIAEWDAIKANVDTLALLRFQLAHDKVPQVGVRLLQVVVVDHDVEVARGGTILNLNARRIQPLLQAFLGFRLATP